MDRAQRLGMVCGYFLSRDDGRAYASFGLNGVEATHAHLGERLGVKPKSIQNWRDEFDPIHPNPRRGRWQRPMFPTRLAVVTALCTLGFDELCRLVHAVIDDPVGRNADALCRSLDAAVEEGAAPGPEPASEVTDGDDAGARMRTGQAAEEFFVHDRLAHELVRNGELVDCRLDGRGYDFRLLTDGPPVLVEVKGLAGPRGGILFTDREWLTAEEHVERYVLALVRDVATAPRLSLLADPTARLQAVPTVRTAVSVDRAVSDARLRVALP